MKKLMLEKIAVNEEKGIEVSFQMWYYTDGDECEEYGAVVRYVRQKNGKYIGEEVREFDDEEEGDGIFKEWTSGHGFKIKIDKRW